MKKLILASVTFLLLAGASGYFYYFSTKTGAGKKVTVGGRIFQAEVAFTPQERFLGLSDRDNLCENCAMLFEFSELGFYPFVMRGMKFPLDIIWIKNNKVVDIAYNVPPDYQGTLNPAAAAEKALEINGGLAEKYGLKKGDNFEFE